MEACQDAVQITFRIRRFNPETDAQPRWVDYPVTVRPGMTVLEGLHQVREELDATLAWRFSCRMGVCGSCAMVINRMPQLACNTQILQVSRAMLRIEPLWNFDIVKDLVPDLGPMFHKHRAVEAFLQRYDPAEVENADAEFVQTPDELTEFLQFAYCIKCGLCMAACPTLATDANYLGPMPLTAARRYNADSRDEGFAHRRRRLDTPTGPFRCHYAGECSRVCPKGVDPARAIQLLKRELIADSFGLRKA